MSKEALAVIDIQNDITRHYKDNIETLNAAVDWALESGMEIVYMRHNNLSPGPGPSSPAPEGRSWRRS